MTRWPCTTPRLVLGREVTSSWRKPVTLDLAAAKTHMHVIGVSGSGKSRFLAGLFLELHAAGLPTTLIDPHGDLARLVLGHLIHKGVHGHPDALEKVLYLDLPGAERRDLFLPFNVLAPGGSPHTIASNVKEAFHRAWPALGGGAAPMFDTLVQDGVKVLITSKLPLTALYRLLTDRGWRDELLRTESDPDIVAFFHDQFDRLSERDRTDAAGAALRRAHLLTFSPVLKYSLGQTGMALNFRELFDAGRSAIINLAIADAEARRLLGCLLMVAAEQAALSRSDLPPEERGRSHHVIIDEFSEFTAQSEEALARMLSQSRKFGMFLVMAHQTWSQASERLRGSLQNVGIDVAFSLGRPDAEHSSLAIAHVNPRTLRQRAWEGDESVGMREQWEETTQQLQNQWQGEAVISYYTRTRPPWYTRILATPSPRNVKRFQTMNVPDPRVDRAELTRIEEAYLTRYFTPRARVEEAGFAMRAHPRPGRTRRAER